MLELGRSGSEGAQRGTVPVLCGGAVVATLRAAHWKGSWTVDLEGTPVEVTSASRWKGTHRFLVAGRVVAESGVRGWSARPTLEAQPGLALDHAVFLVWFGLVLGRRAAAAVAAA